MKVLITILMAVVSIISAGAYKYSYTFHDIPISQAIVRISKDNPDIGISFIYKELDNYKTSATINADEPYDALRQLIGLNPISVTKKDNNFFIEALQRGKFKYTGRAIGSDNEPVIAATVMLLAPKDSTIITYGLTDEAGLFSIPCDRKEVIAKLTCLGYSPTYRNCDSFSLGTIVMKQLPVKLQTLKVNADAASLYSDKSIYRPTQRQKEIAQSANDLLLHMAIPQLIVDPTSHVVTTTTGQPVSLFINGVTATQQDLDGMKTSDVKKVEFMLNPQDVRFKGAQYAVNFIMQNYEWGGYTKINANKSFVVNDDNGLVYSKFAYKKMIFDLSAGSSYESSHHEGMKSSETFRFTDLYGKGPQTVERISDTSSSLHRFNKTDLSLRAMYNTDKSQISNLLQINNSATPHNDRTDNLIYDDDIFPESTVQKIESNKSFLIYNAFSLYYSFNSKVALNLVLEYRYERNKSNYDYNDMQLNVINNAKEESRQYKAVLFQIWNPNKNNSIMPFLATEYVPSSVDYLGSSPSRQKYNIFAGMVGSRYTYNRTNWSAGGLVGWIFGYTDLSGIKTFVSYPQAEVFGNYSYNQKNQMEFRYFFRVEVPATFQKSPNMLQQDRLLWYAGTPTLGDIWSHQFTLSYTWIPNKTWRFNFYGNCFMANNRVVPVYTPDGPEGTMLRKYVNDGHYSYTTIGVSGNASFFNGKLVAKLSPYYCLNKTSGEYRHRVHNPFCSASLTWYFGNFYLSGWYCTPLKDFRLGSGTIIYSPCKYQFNIGWGKGEWRASVTAYNFLRTGWKGNRYTLNSQYYSSESVLYGMNMHMQFQLSASYTFGYGKKVQKDNEISTTVTPNSAILK